MKAKPHFMPSLVLKGSLSLLIVLTLCLLGNVAEAQAAQCNDNIDNDGDMRVDLNDLGCTSSSDDNETAQVNGTFTNWIPANNITAGFAQNLSFGFGVNDDTGEIDRIKFRVTTIGRPWSEYEALEQDFAAPYEYSAASLNRVTAGNNKVIHAQIYGRRGTNPNNLYLISSSYYITRFLSSSSITNQPPNVNAGLDQAITLPSTASLSATVTDDGLPNPPSTVTKTWSKTSGPGTVTLSTPNSLNTTVTFSVPGTYVLRLTANDSALSAYDEVSIIVNATISVNAAPTVNAGANQTITLPEVATLDATASDDGLPNPPGVLTYSWTKVSGQGTVTFGNPNAVDTTASFSIAGSYTLRLTVNDSALSASDDIDIMVNPVPPVNQAPVLDPIGNKSVNENNLLSFVISGSDPNNDPLTYSASNLPSGAIFDALTRTFTWTPNYTQSGNYNMTFRVSDGTLDDSELITVNVGNVNRAPVLNAIGNRSVNENQLLSFVISGSDPDNDPLTYSAETLPQGANFNPLTRTFTWTPSLTQSGNYNMTFRVSDGTLDDSEQIMVTVANVNQAPVLNSIGNRTVNENQLLSFVISGSDPNNDPLTYSASNLPSGAIFNPQTRTFTWTPSLTQSGNYNMTFRVSDGTLDDSELITVNVGNVNQAPVLNSIGNRTVNENQLLNFVISGSDPDNDPLTYSAETLPQGAIFNAQTRTFTWTPSLTQSGNYNMTFRVSDGTLDDSELITVNVGNVNQAPVLNSIGNRTVNEAQLLSFVISGSDPDNDPLTYTASNLPSGSSFNAQNRTFTWTPNYTQSGNYNVTFRVSDGTFDDSELITVTVANVIVNTAPIVNAGANQTITLPNTATLDGTVSDDGLPNPPATLTRTWTRISGPGTVTFGNANALSTTATFSLAGTYVLRLTASDSVLSTYDDVTITINPAPPVNQAPIVNVGANQNITLPTAAILAGSVTDDGLPNPPATVITAWTKASGPGTVTFGNANALNTTATFSAAGTYVLRLTANDGGVLPAYDELLVSVTTTSGAVTSNRLSPLGTNVSGVSYYYESIPTKNLVPMHNMGTWTHVGWPPIFESVALAPDGYPLGLPANRVVETNVLFDRPLWKFPLGSYPTGDYVMLFDGDGDLNIPWGGDVTIAPTTTFQRTGTNRYTFNIPVALNGFKVQITRSNPNNHARNFRIIKAEYEAPGPENYETQPFQPDFLEMLRPYSALRLMAWTDSPKREVPQFKHFVDASPTTVKLPWAASSVDHAYDGKRIRFTNAAGLEQTRTITGYVGSTKIGTVDSLWNPVPRRGDPFVLEGTSPSMMITESLESATANTVILGPSSSNVDNFYKGMVIVTFHGTPSVYAIKYIDDYVGATRTAHISSNFTTIPPNGTNYYLFYFPQRRWADRAHPDWMSYNIQTEQSIPVEIMVQLANTLHADPWFSLPPAADDNYVQQFATYVMNNLDPSLKPYFETSNELWNTAGFNGNIWATARGAELGQGHGAWAWNSVRAVEISKIISDVYGEPYLRSQRTNGSRFYRVLAWQFSWCGQGAWMMDFDSSQITSAYPSPFAPGTKAADYLDVGSFAPYFGYFPGENAVGRSLDAIFTRTEQFIDEMFMPGATCGQYPRSYVYRNVVDAQTRGLIARPYEGGQHFVSDFTPYFYGTVAAADYNTVTLTIPSWQNIPSNYFTGRYITLRTNLGAGQTRRIVAYDGPSKVATLETAWVTVPNNTSTYVIRTESNLKEDDLNSDPRMGDLYTRYYEYWRNLGLNPNTSAAQTFFVFSDIGGQSQFGRWGNQSYMNQPMSETPKKQAIWDFMTLFHKWWAGN